jgi:membrane protease subunit HflK
MAWNEPGGSGNKDPWGSRSPEQGPPDLDEVVRRLQRKLGGLFGGGSSSGGTGNGFGGFGLIIGALVLLWALSGLYIIDEGKRGVVLQFGAYKETTGAGLHWYPRFIQSMQKVDIEQVRSIDLGANTPEESSMLTQDENIIDIKFTVQYQVSNPRDYLFNVRNPEETLQQAMESAIREVVGKSDMDFIITGGRSEVVARAQKLMQELLDKYQTGLTVTSLNMQDAQAPQQVQGAFLDAIKAREDEQRLKNEAEAYANDILPKARGQAARIEEEANAYREQVILQAKGETERFLKVFAEYQKAPSVMRSRLYIDAMESVLSKSSKVVVDTKGNNNLLYLPLDKMTGRSPAATSAPATAEAAPPVEIEAARQGIPADTNVLKREVR